MDTDRRHETRGSETKDIITHGKSNSLSVSIWATSPSPNSHKAMKSGPGDACTHTGLSYRRGALSLRNPDIL